MADEPLTRDLPFAECVAAIVPKPTSRLQPRSAGSRESALTTCSTCCPNWKDITKVTVSRITLDGLKRVGEAGVMHGKLSLSLEKGAAVAIVPAGER